MTHNLVFWKIEVFFIIAFCSRKWSHNLAQQDKQQLAVLLLDFEKAYDKVDWDFLEAVLLRLGFLAEWIKGVSALSWHASSSVLFARDYGPLFPISKSVRK